MPTVIRVFAAALLLLVGGGCMVIPRHDGLYILTPYASIVRAVPDAGNLNVDVTTGTCWIGGGGAGLIDERGYRVGIQPVAHSRVMNPVCVTILEGPDAATLTDDPSH